MSRMSFTDWIATLVLVPISFLMAVGLMHILFGLFAVVAMQAYQIALDIGGLFK